MVLCGGIEEPVSASRQKAQLEGTAVPILSTPWGCSSANARPIARFVQRDVIFQYRGKCHYGAFCVLPSPGALDYLGML